MAAIKNLGCFPLPDECSTVLLLGSCSWPPARLPGLCQLLLQDEEGRICSDPSIPLFVFESLNEKTS